MTRTHPRKRSSGARGKKRGGKGSGSTAEGIRRLCKGSADLLKKCEKKNGKEKRLPRKKRKNGEGAIREKGKK